MISIHGQLLPEFPLPDLKKIADLIYYDGPFLSLFSSNEGKNYFYYWCDSNDTSNRWLVFELDGKTLNDFLSKKLPLRKVIQNAIEGFVISVDIEGGFDSYKFLNPTKLSVLSLPDEYLPEEDSFYAFEPLFSQDLKHENLLEITA